MSFLSSACGENSVERCLLVRELFHGRIYRTYFFPIAGYKYPAAAVAAVAAAAAAAA